MLALLVFFSIILFINIYFSQTPQTTIYGQISNFISNFLLNTRQALTSLIIRDFYCPQSYHANTNDIINAAWISMIITLLIGLIRYLFSSTFSAQQKTFSGIAEAIQIDNIILTILLFITVFAFYSSLSLNTSTGVRYIYSESAHNYSVFMIREGLFVMTTMALLTESINLLSYIQFPILHTTEAQRLNPFHMEIAVGQVLRPLSDSMSILITFINSAVFAWSGIFMLLCFVEAYGLTYLLIIGIFLRNFPFTKNAGDTLIALSVGLFFILPFMLHVNSVIYKILVGDFSGFNWPEQSIISFISILYSFFVAFFVAGLAGNVFQGIFSSFAGFLPFTKIFIFISVAFLAILFFVKLLQLFSIYVLIFSIFFNVINVLIIVGFTRELSKILGTPLDISSLLRLI
ncbi:MAG: hypothetical protein QXI89_01770 [Candidatus Anstonellales archaeon]